MRDVWWSEVVRSGRCGSETAPESGHGLFSGRLHQGKSPVEAPPTLSRITSSWGSSSSFRAVGPYLGGAMGGGAREEDGMPGPEPLKPASFPARRAGWDPWCPQKSEDSMRGLGVALLTGAAAVVLWKIFAAMFIGLLALAFKVALVFGVVYFLMKVFQDKKNIR